MSDAGKFPLVSVLRGELDKSPWYGFVVGRSGALLMLNYVNDAYSLDGFLVMLQRDVTSEQESFSKRALVEDALRLKDQEPKAAGALNLSCIQELIESVQAHYPVLVINAERVRPGEVEVGTVRMASQESYVLRWLSGTADWENDDRPFRYRDITLLQFGGEYEQTLALVALARKNGV